VDITPHGVHRTKPITPRLPSTQPENAAEYPVSLRILARQFTAVDFASRTPPDQHSPLRQPGPDSGADVVPTSRRTATPLLLAGSVKSSRHGIGLHDTLAVHQGQTLRVQGYIQPNGRWRR